MPCAIQLPYSLSGRDAERELMPLAAGLGLSVLAWGVMGAGVLTGKYTAPGGEPRRYGDHSPSERRAKVIEAIAQTAASCAATPAQICITWALSRRSEVELIPIVGARTASQLEENLAALHAVLPADALARLEEATAIDRGFPPTFLGDHHVVGLILRRPPDLIASQAPTSTGA